MKATADEMRLMPDVYTQRLNTHEMNKERTQCF